MTDINAMLAAQRRLMWMLPPAERERRLAAVEADYLLEEQLRAVAFAMQEPRAEPIAKTVAINRFQLLAALLILSPVIWMLAR